MSYKLAMTKPIQESLLESEFKVRLIHNTSIKQIHRNCETDVAQLVEHFHCNLKITTFEREFCNFVRKFWMLCLCYMVNVAS